MMQNPCIGECWLHTNGNEYMVEGFTNENSTKEKYPVTIIYRNISNNAIYSRPLNDWHRSLTRNEIQELIMSDYLVKDIAFDKQDADLTSLRESTLNNISSLLSVNIDELTLGHVKQASQKTSPTQTYIQQLFKEAASIYRQDPTYYKFGGKRSSAVPINK